MTEVVRTASEGVRRTYGGSPRGAGDVRIGGSLVRYSIGGREFTYKSDPRCKVCNHPYRKDIERAIMVGRTYRTIIDFYGDDDVTEISLKHHVGLQPGKGHMPVDALISRVVLEQMNKDQGEALEDIEGTLVSHWSFLKDVLRMSHENMVEANGRIVTPENGIAAAKMLAELEARTEGNADAAIYSEAFEVFFHMLSERVSHEFLADFMQDLRGNPVLQGLMVRARAERMKRDDRLTSIAS